MLSKLAGLTRHWVVFWHRKVDARVYDLLRIGYAVTALVNLGRLFPLRYTIYSSSGMWDTAVTLSSNRGPSIFYYVSSQGAIDVVFCLAIAAGLGALLGYRTRLALLSLFIWNVSSGNVLGQIGYSTDAILRVVGFILLFSPSGGCWSMDSRRNSTPAAAPHCPLAPAYGLILIRWQLVILYACAVFPKYANQYWRSGELVSYFVLCIYSLFPYPEIAAWRKVSVLLTYATLLIETYVCLLLFLPQTRLLGFILGYGLHISILLLSNVGCLSIAVMFMYFAFLNGNDVERLVAAVRAWRKRYCVARSGTRPMPSVE